MEITEFTIPSGSKGGGGKQHTPEESADSLHSVAKMRMLIALSEGVIKGGLDGKRIFLNGTPLQGQDGSMNFPGVRWEFRPGSATQDPIKGFPAVERPGTVGVDLLKAQPWVHEITDINLDAFRLRMGFPYMALTEDDGDTVGTSVEYTIELSTDGGAYQMLSRMRATGKTTTLYERDHRIDLPKATTKWSVRVTRVTADSASQKLLNKTQIQGFTEVIDARMRYPHTALLFIEYDAKTFPQVPRVSCKLYGREIQVPSNYDPETRVYNGDWDGTFKWAWSDNPAWVYYDIAINDRFSIGRKVKANMLSKWDLYVIAQRCDQLVPNGDGGTGKEPRFTCNMYIQGQEQAFNVLRDIVSIFNGATFWGNSQLNVVSDMPGDVKQIITRAGVVDGKFNYTGGSQKNRYSAALVSVSDQSNHYNDLPVMVIDPRLQKRYGYQQTQVSAIGCSSVGQGQRRGKYILLSNELDRAVSFKMGLDGIQFLPGHIIALADERLAGKVMGGRVKETSADRRTVTFDRVTGAAVGDALLVRTKDGKPERRTINTVNGAVVGLNTALTAAPAAYATFVIDSGNLALQTFKVQSLKRSDGEDCFEVVALIHNASKYDAIDKGARLDIPNVSLLPVPGLKAPTNIKITAYDAIRQGLRVKTMRITWDKMPGALAYELQWRKDDGDWINGPRQPVNAYEVEGIYAGDYYARVRSIGVNEISSPWGESQIQTLPGRDGAPAAPVMGAAVKLQYGIQWLWTFAQGAGDTASTELQYQPLADPTSTPSPSAWLPLTLVAYPTGKYQQMGLGMGQRMAVRARCLDRLGNQSPWTPAALGTSNEVVSDYIKDLDKQIQDSQAFKDLTTKIDTDLDKVGEDMEALGAQVDTVVKTVNGDPAKPGDTGLVGKVQTISGTVENQGKVITTMQQTVQLASDDASRALSGAGNIFPDGTFDTYAAGFAFSSVGKVINTDKVSGANCLETTTTTTQPDAMVVGFGAKLFASNGARRFYVEFYAKASITLPAGNEAYVGVGQYDASGSSLGAAYVASSNLSTSWRKFSGYVTQSAATVTAIPRVGGFGPKMPTGTKIYYDNIVVTDVTDAKNAQDDAAAAQARALQVLNNGNNAFPDGTFESYASTADMRTVQPGSGSSYTELQTSGAYAGGKCLKLIAQDANNADNSWSLQYLPVTAGQWWYVSYMCRINSGSVPSNFNGVGVGLDVRKADGSNNACPVIVANASNGDDGALNGTWKRFSGWIQIPADGALASIFIDANHPNGTTWPANTSFFLDQIVIFQDDSGKRANDTVATVQTTANASRDKLGNYDATWTVKAQVDSGGRHYMAGISAGVSMSGGEYQANVLINANNFAVYVPGANSDNGVPKNQFTVNAQGVWMNTAMIQDATITNAKIANAAINDVKIADGAITNAKIANASINNAKITGTLSSQNTEAGKGWTLNQDGTFTCSGATIHGVIQADRFIGDVAVQRSYANTFTNTTAPQTRTMYYQNAGYEMVLSCQFMTACKPKGGTTGAINLALTINDGERVAYSFQGGSASDNTESGIITAFVNHAVTIPANKNKVKIFLEVSGAGLNNSTWVWGRPLLTVTRNNASAFS